MCISSKKGPSLSTQMYFSGRIRCNRKHDLMFFQKNEGKRKKESVVSGGGDTKEHFWRLFGTAMFPHGKTIIRKKKHALFLEKFRG